MQDISKSVAILGSGVVGRALAAGFIDAGYFVEIGTRNPDKPELDQIKAKGARTASYADAAASAAILVVATPWEGTREMISLAGESCFAGKLVLDATNPLDFSAGPLPKSAVAFPGSGGAEIQAWLPEARVVKVFNTITSGKMVNPEYVEGTPVMFICGEVAAAKDTAREILIELGWTDVVDLGGIANAWMLEALAFLWISYGFANNSWTHAFALLRK